jgi:type 1 fimbria pilin
MKKRLIATGAMFIGLLFSSVSLSAHHGNAEFAIGKTVTVKGTVTKWFWANPHCILSFDAKADDGQVIHWVVETQPPQSIVPGGFSKQTFKPGDVVTITLEPVKNGLPLGRMLGAVLPDGTKLVTGHLD